MTGKKGHSGGPRTPGPGKKLGKPPQNRGLVTIRIAAPQTEAERKALRYAKWLSPEDRLKVFQEDETFQDWDDPGPIII